MNREIRNSPLIDVTAARTELDHVERWQYARALATARRRLDLRFALRNALITFSPFWALIPFQSRLGPSLYETLSIVALAAVFVAPFLVMKVVLERRNYEELPLMQQYMLFACALGYLSRIPRRDELLVIPDMREDAKSIFFPLSYWIYPRERA